MNNLVCEPSAEIAEAEKKDTNKKEAQKKEPEKKEAKKATTKTITFAQPPSPRTSVSDVAPYSPFDRVVPRQDLPEHVLMVGIPHVGKSTIVSKMKLGKHSDRPVTSCNVGGRHAGIPFWKYSAPNTIGLIFVVDRANKDSLDTGSMKFIGLYNVRIEFNTITFDDALKDVPLLIFANKQDVKDAMSVETIADRLGLNSQAWKNRKFYIQACSGKNNEGIDEGLDWLCDEM